MKNIFSYAAMAATMILAQSPVNAQMPYNVTTANQAYVPLTNATSLSNNILWSDTSEFNIPLGFNFQFGGTGITNFALSQSNLFTPSLSGVQSGFAMLGTSIQDRNYPGGVPASPVQYALSGTSGNRILKLEIKNAGFATEKDLYATNNDFVNIQIWFYEQDHSVAFHFGPSSITHFDDYFGQKMPLGFMKALDMNTFSFQKFYCLNGNPASPGMDSLINLNTPSGFTTYPAAGTIYRFTPKSGATAIDNLAKIRLGKIYPVPATDALYIESAAKSYTIVSMTGQYLAGGDLKSGRERISLNSLLPGMYLLHLRNEKNETDVQKFVKH